MKKIIAGAAFMAAVLVSNNVTAQDSSFKKWKKHPGKEQHNGGQAIKQLQERLKLTNDQAKQVTEINNSAKEKLKEAHKDGAKPDMQTRRSIIMERDAATKKVLTTEQLTEYDKLKAERKAMHDKKEPKKDEVE